MTLFEVDEPQDTPAPAAPSGPLVRVRLLVAYHGAGFHGFAPNRQVRTVGGVLTEAIEKVVGSPVTVTCAGRTDTGVHAWGQVVHADLPEDVDLGTLQKSLLRMLAPEVVVRAVDVAPEGFDARRTAVARLYRYTVLNRPTPDPFLAATTWHVPDPLDLRAMRLACDPLIGEHDFSSFCRRPEGEGHSMTRRVVAADWVDLGEGLLRFDIEASAFCHQMVRSLVGTLVAMGLGRLRAGEMAGILRSQDRSLAAQPAPPHGLCLWEVRYPGT
ncbi:MAG TPA: tRNA pseudouridine(38-40) synthase TruA [Acidimicrobiales bacterium]|nr:tRNA pseudouridine(38-40) synthase TruA [Acidimicrobiales bacterium]